MRRLRPFLILAALAFVPGCVVTDGPAPVHGYGQSYAPSYGYAAPRYYPPAPRPYYAPRAYYAPRPHYVPPRQWDHRPRAEYRPPPRWEHRREAEHRPQPPREQPRQPPPERRDRPQREYRGWPVR